MESNPVNLKKMREASYPVKPEYMPCNESAKHVLDLIYKQLDCTPKGSGKGKRVKAYTYFLSGFLAATQRASVVIDGVITIPRDSHYWSQYKHVGRQVANNVTEGLIRLGLIDKVHGSGEKHIWQDDQGNWCSDGVASQYNVSDTLIQQDAFGEAVWTNVGKTEVLISKEETFLQRQRRISEGRKSIKLTSNQVEMVFNKRDYKKIGLLERRVRKLNTHWLKHPLVIPPNVDGYCIHCSSATRIFHNGSIRSGGRYYGEWTNLKSWSRRRATIDGETIVQIDLNASQPTLFSSLMGYKMGVGKKWEDLYDVVVEPLEGEDKRAKAKQVAMELIGTGNPYKKAPASDCNIEFNSEGLAADGEGNILNEYGVYRHRLLEVVPALAELNREYLNGAGYLSYHEAEIMTLSLEKLMSLDIPAYPMHDCLIVKKSDQDKAIDVYRATARQYIYEQSTKNGQSSINIILPITIEYRGDKHRLAGYYLD
jgi:hypothetical protein